MSEAGPGRAADPVRLLYPAILVTSAVGIAFQIALMRVLSIGQWHHFAYMIISVAMLGFAVSGTVLALLGARIRGHEPFLFRLGAALLPLAIAGSFTASQHVPFETFELVSRPGQFWNLLWLYALLAIPFYHVSWCIALGFLMRPRQVGRVYFVNMVGSGLGAAAAVGCLFLLDPGSIAFGLGIPAASVLPLSLWREPARRVYGWLAVLAATSTVAVATGSPSIRISPYKGLAYALQLPDATVAARRWSPLSVLTAVRSSLIRETPGQISNYPMDELGPLPEQIALYFDAGAVSPINRFHGDPAEVKYLDYVTAALPYRLLDNPEVVVVGAGGGTEVLNALHHGARHVTAVEVNRLVLELAREEFASFSGGLYDRPDVSPVVADGRRYLEMLPAGSQDVIQIALLDSFNATAAGVHALSESYLYTVQAMAGYLEALRDGGLLSVTRWITSPPRDAIKMFATLVEAARRAGIDEPGRHLLMIRSWNTATLILSRSPLTPLQVSRARQFADSRWFDLAYYPGMTPEEANRFVILDEPVYQRAATAILSADRDRFYRDYPYHIRPATDDRPHYSRFFRWASLPAVVAAGRSGTGGPVEWGYLTLVATLAQAVLLATGLVLLPLLLVSGWQRRRGPDTRTGTRSGSRARKTPVLLYFGALGLAYMFLEIAFIQKLMLFLAHPIYAVSVVLTGFLVFSGLGSYYADRHRTGHRLVVKAVAFILLLIVGYHLSLAGVFRAGFGWPAGARVVVSLGLLAPLAFAMGIPFPVGLQMLSDSDGSLVPWAWGWNGAMSVVGAALAAWIAVHLGFSAVTVLAALLYLGASAAIRAVGEARQSQPGGES